MSTASEIAPMIAAAGSGVERLFEFGILGILTAIGLTYMMWSSYQCTQSTKAVVENNTKALLALKESNTIALHGVEKAISKVEGRMERHGD